MEAGHYTTRWKKADPRQSFDLARGEYDGNGITFGRRVSDACLRVYNKRLERVVKGFEDPGHWIRAELELKRKRADAAAELYQAGDVQGFFRHLAGVIRGYIEFKTPNPSDSNKRRWDVVSWWSRFLDGCEKARLSLQEQVKRTVESVMAWLDRSVGPSLAVVLEVLGQDGDAWFRDVLKDGKRRWKGKHRMLASEGLSL